LRFLVDRIRNSGPKSVRIAALLDKKDRRVVPCEADFLGEEVPNLFLVGYGLDWAEKYRTLASIYAVRSG
jgi:hypoxanthine phosphoribosyltransferase